MVLAYSKLIEIIHKSGRQDQFSTTFLNINMNFLIFYEYPQKYYVLSETSYFIGCHAADLGLCMRIQHSPILRC